MFKEDEPQLVAQNCTFLLYMCLQKPVNRYRSHL